MIRQGEIYWCDFGTPMGSEPGYLRPVIVVQNDVFNLSRIQTTVVCGLTTNLEYGRARFNVVLDAGEAGLPQQSVVNVSQISTVDRRMLERHIGSVSSRRLDQIVRGVTRLMEPRGSRD